MKRNVFQSMITTVFLFLVGLTVSSCQKTTPNPTTNTSNKDFSNGFFVINEGTFNKGNASVMFAKKTDFSIGQDVYSQANGISIGDVCQSMTYHNGYYYVVVNNSQKIVVLDEKTMVQKSVISELPSPRYMVFNQDSEVYVSNLYGNQISVLRVGNNGALTLKNTIPVHGYSEEMQLVGSELFVCMVKRNHVYVIDIHSKTITDSISVGEDDQWIQKDKNGKLWVLSNYFLKTKPATLQRINPANHKVEQTFNFISMQDSPSKLRLNSTGDMLYFINKDVYGMSIDALSLPTTPLILANAHNFYGMRIDPYTDNIFVCDAKDYISDGEVFCYSKSGVYINGCKTGIIPTDFYFTK